MLLWAAAYRASRRVALEFLTALPFLLGAFLLIGASPASSQTLGLVAAYGFEEGSGSSALDSSGNSNTGTLGSGVTRTSSSQGRFGAALSYNGAGYVTIPGAASLNLTSAMTLEAWVFPTAAAGNWSTVLMKEQPGHFVYTLYAGSPTNRPNVYFNTSTASGGQRGLAGPSALPLNAWSHLAGTYDGATLRLYVNGAQVASQAYTGSIMVSSGALRIGGNDIWSGEYFQGRIDEIRIYNRALTQASIQTDMNAPVAGAPQPDTQPPAPPGNLTATGNLTGSVSLTWSAATDNVGVAAYNIHRSTSNGFTPSPGNRIGQSTTLNYVDVISVGTYYYRATAQDAAGNISAPSNQATGVSQASSFAGPLRRNPANTRYFTDGTGKAIYLAGSHTWSNLKDFGPTDPPAPFDYDLFLAFLQGNNHNFFRLWTWELPYSSQNGLPPWYHTPFPWPRSGPGLASDGKPKFDLSRFDQAYFDRLRLRVVKAGQRGIYASIMLWDGFGPQFERS